MLDLLACVYMTTQRLKCANLGARKRGVGIWLRYDAQSMIVLGDVPKDKRKRKVEIHHSKRISCET